MQSEFHTPQNVNKKKKEASKSYEAATITSKSPQKLDLKLIHLEPPQSS